MLAAIVLAVGFSSYAVLSGSASVSGSPYVTTALLLAILVPLMTLVVLLARRMALLLARRRAGTAGARLHVRLVALFAAIAAAPTLLVVVFASLLFQFGVQFWFSDHARTVLANADAVAQAYVRDARHRLEDDSVALASDVAHDAALFGVQSPIFRENLALQVSVRDLTEAAMFTADGHGHATIYARAVGPRETRASKLDLPTMVAHLSARDLAVAARGPALLNTHADRTETLTRIAGSNGYVYASRRVDPRVLGQVARTRTALDDYSQIVGRSRALRWQFNLVLLVVSLVIVAVAIAFALWLANRLVAPIARLADAAERVGEGDLDARVPLKGNPDELGQLARAFNRMTAQLKAQQGALVTANGQAELRRRFMETVLSGVSAGVVSIDADTVVRLANRSAAELLELGDRDFVGHPLAEAAPEFADLLDIARVRGSATGEVRIARGGEPQTLAVRIADAGGARSYVLTFDDISAQLADQRRAAWADVARRIAHEIKNPLTPIQLSAERLKRKYLRQVTEDPELFVSLTDTIVRQVGDLRRMVDEFSSFARMPKPVFHDEDVREIAAQALLLQEVANPEIGFELDAPAALPPLACDRRQIGQALTNLLKNAAESVAAAQAQRTALGRVWLRLTHDGDRLTAEVADNGLGLPVAERQRLTEPYVTTRARGTGLGLAIVKKIVEDHGGALELGDRVGGGAVARLCFDLSRAPATQEDEHDMPMLHAAGGR